MSRTWTSEELGVDVSDLDLDDLGDFYRAWNRCKQAKKELNRKFSTELLTKLNIDFDQHNYGIHLVVYSPTSSEIIDFWPSTGKWIVRNGKTGRGIKNLLRHMNINTNQAN